MFSSTYLSLLLTYLLFLSLEEKFPSTSGMALTHLQLWNSQLSFLFITLWFPHLVNVFWPWMSEDTRFLWNASHVTKLHSIASNDKVISALTAVRTPNLIIEFDYLKTAYCRLLSIADSFEAQFLRVLNKVNHTIERNELRLTEQERRDVTEVEWKQVALVCDRFLLWAFLLATAITTTVILCGSPYGPWCFIELCDGSNMLVKLSNKVIRLT